MARTKSNTQNDTKTRTTSWRNIHLEKLYFCVFRIFLFKVHIEKKYNQSITICGELSSTPMSRVLLYTGVDTVVYMIVQNVFIIK